MGPTKSDAAYPSDLEPIQKREETQVWLDREWSPVGQRAQRPRLGWVDDDEIFHEQQPDNVLASPSSKDWQP